MFIFIYDRTRRIPSDAIIHWISVLRYSTIIFITITINKLGSRTWEVKSALVKGGRDLISLNIITIELSASCCLLSFFIYGRDGFVYYFKPNISPLFGLLILLSLQPAAGMSLIFYLEFAMILENGTGKLSITDSAHFTNSQSFSAEKFVFKTLRKSLHIAKSLWIFKLFWFGNNIYGVLLSSRM